MAKIKEEHKITYGGDAVITMREPDGKELRHFNMKRVKVGKKGKISTAEALEGRLELFDKVCTAVENLEDHDGTPITLENLDRIPPRLRADWIMDTFEGGEDEDQEELDKTEKNS